jgi:hypothetical protein
MTITTACTKNLTVPGIPDTALRWYGDCVYRRAFWDTPGSAERGSLECRAGSVALSWTWRRKTELPSVSRYMARASSVNAAATRP